MRIDVGTDLVHARAGIVAAISAAAARLHRVLRHAGAAFDHRRRRAIQRDELAAMNDHELRDIGMSREALRRSIDSCRGASAREET